MKYLRRKIDAQLLKWKESPRRKPLLLRGARQVGKSYSVRHLGESFDSFLEVNFEEVPEARRLFEMNLEIEEICNRLGILFGQTIVEGKTLLFLDEVQVCPAAIHALWFFKERLPGLHVIAAGSLLEFAIKKMPSYGVGRITSMYMYPMDYEEYLWAEQKDAWTTAICEASPDSPLFEPLHSQLVNSYRMFLIVGGMPASVNAWVETRDFNVCIDELTDIQESYYDDFNKYAKSVDITLLNNTLQSVIRQVGRKFMYSNVAGGYHENDVKQALTMLKDAGLIHLVEYSTANGLPLGAEVNPKFFKYLYLDTGLLMRAMSFDQAGQNELTELILTGSAADLVNKGAMAELSVGLELLKNSDSRRRCFMYYWQNIASGTSSEVDYILGNQGKVLPLEVKAGTSGKMKSLRLFMEKKNLTTGLRCSLENFGRLEISNGNSPAEILIIPAYAISRYGTADR
ncbi:MAG: ATP-binding protein [Bacteroides sp.]|nr:ATP-binding protein [Bacteroides sp.]MBD5306350.1 ATP-binding protein [Bacteroides sp.]